MSGDVTGLLEEIRSGNQEAESQLIRLVYPELHRRAAGYLRRERPGHTLQTTELINEVYLKLVEGRKVEWKDRAHFFAVAAKQMRHVLVDHARAHKQIKRGGAQQQVSLSDTAVIRSKAQIRKAHLDTQLDLDRALSRLAEEYPRQSQVFELRHFGGLSVDETAEVVKVSSRTVKSDWQHACAFLDREIRRAT